MAGWLEIPLQFHCEALVSVVRIGALEHNLILFIDKLTG